MKQLQLDLPDEAIETSTQKTWRMYPSLLTEPTFKHCQCHLQAIHSFRNNKHLLHFIYYPEQRLHLPSSTRWRKILRRHRFSVEEIRLIRRISKVISLASHRGRELVLPKKLHRQYESSLQTRIRFKKPLPLDCLRVECQVGSSYTAGHAELLCYFIPETNQFFVLKTTYIQCTRTDIGFSGIRRTAILEQIQRHCVAYWKHHLTLPLFP